MAACGYATVAIWAKWIFNENISMYNALIWRFGGAALLLWFFLFFQKRVHLPFKKRMTCFLIGVVGDALQTSLFFFSIARIGASLATILVYTFPFFVFLIQRFVFKQAASRMQWVSLGVSFLGCILVINPFTPITPSPEYWTGVFFGLGTGVAYACYIAFGAHFTKNLPALNASAHLTTGAFTSFLILAFTQGTVALPATQTEWTLAALLMLAGTLIPLLCLIKGMQLIGATQTSLLFTIEPVITVSIAALLLHEPLTWTNVLGALLVLTSAFLIQKRKARPSEKASVLENF